MKNKKRIRKLLVLILILAIVFIAVIFIRCGINKNKEDYKIVSKYNTVTKNYQDVKVKISKVIRGNDAQKLFDKYNNSTNYAIKMNLADEEELMIVEYKIDFMNFDMGEVGANKDIEASICIDEDNNYIKYNDKIYFSSVRYMNNLDFTKAKKDSGKFITNIPKGLTQYKIKIGIEGQNKYYFDGI